MRTISSTLATPCLTATPTILFLNHIILCYVCWVIFDNLWGVTWCRKYVLHSWTCFRRLKYHCSCSFVTDRLEYKVVLVLIEVVSCSLRLVPLHSIYLQIGQNRLWNATVFDIDLLCVCPGAEGDVWKSAVTFVAFVPGRWGLKGLVM